MMQSRIHRVRLSSKGQIVIPKVLRDKYKLKEGSLLRVIAEEEKIVIMPEIRPPFTGLRDLMKKEWNKRDLDELIREAKRSLFKV